MGKKIIKWAGSIVLVSIILKSVIPGLTAGSPPQAQDSITINVQSSDPVIVEKIHTLIPVAVNMLDNSIILLSKGWQDMTPAEQELFNRFFDPAGTGDVDEEFVQDVLENYRKIRAKLDTGLAVEYEPDQGQCTGMRLYYTEFIKVHVCPYLKTETNVNRMARDFVHELGHMAMISQDRPYYFPTSADYAALTPRGPQAAQIPVIGRLVSEIALNDTLYHADAYAWFALILVAPDYGPSGSAHHHGAGQPDVSAENDPTHGTADQKFFQGGSAEQLVADAGPDGADQKFLRR